jgi:acetyl-CoA synthetase
MAKQAADLYKEFDAHIIPPSWKDRAWDPADFKTWYATTVRDKKAMETWWEKWANELFWFKKWNTVLDDSHPPFYRWFVGGETNLAYLATDWQIELGRKDKTALIWEGEPWDEASQKPKEVKKFTYGDLHRESNIISYALRDLGHVTALCTAASVRKHLPREPWTLARG